MLLHFNAERSKKNEYIAAIALRKDEERSASNFKVNLKFSRPCKVICSVDVSVTVFECKGCFLPMPLFSSSDKVVFSVTHWVLWELTPEGQRRE